MRLKLDYHLWELVIIGIICFQLTNLKFLNIKVSEAIMLLYFPVVFLRGRGKVNITIVGFFLSFFAMLVVTFYLNLNQLFYLNYKEFSILKWPYFISFSRFLELFACLSFVIFVRQNLGVLASRNIKYDYALKYFLVANCILSIMFILEWSAIRTNMLSVDSSFFHYFPGTGVRLRGGYIEGGPFGLMYAFLFGLTTFVKKVTKREILVLIKGIFILTIVLAQSKAGYAGVLAWSGFVLFQRIRSKTLRLIAFMFGVVIFLGALSLIANNYIDAYSNLEKFVSLRPDDQNLVMGRLAAGVIVPNMILEKPWLGIGLGNYAHVRNNPIYRDFFPHMELWDSPGFGGVINILVENGIFGLLCFLVTILVFIKLLKKKLTNQFLLFIIGLFLIPQFLGVQQYFFYPWFMIAMGVHVSSMSTTNNMKIGLNE